MFGSHYKNVPHNFSKEGERKKNHCIKVLVSFSLSVKISTTLKRPHSDNRIPTTKTNFHVTIHNQRLSENRRLIYGESLFVTNVSY